MNNPHDKYQLKNALLLTLIVMAVIVGISVRDWLESGAALQRASTKQIETLHITMEGFRQKSVAELSVVLADELKTTRRQLMIRVDAGVTTAQREVQATRAMADEHASLIEKLAGHELAAYRTTLDTRLGEANTNLSNAAIEFHRTNDLLQDVAVPVAGSARQVSDALPLFLDCQWNQDCIFNRYVGTARAIERGSIAMEGMARETEKRLPAFEADASGIASDVHAYTRAATSRKAKILGLFGIGVAAGSHFIP